MSKTHVLRWVVSTLLIGFQCFAHSQDRQSDSGKTALAAVDLLSRNCLVCHGATQTSGLDLRQRLAALKGGKRGPAILPGRPEESLVYVTAAHLGELKMPPGSDSPLPPEQLAILKKWILEGAEWPESGVPLERSSAPPALADTIGQASDEAKQGSLPLNPEFNRDIRSILSDRCFTCHGPDKANRKTALHFDTEEGAFTPLSNGKVAIVRKDPESSEMYRRITSQDIATRMPPVTHKALSVREVELIRRWIEQGAKWQPHWSFIPVKRPQPPEVKDGKGIRNPVDSFVRAVLEREGLPHSLEADRSTLIRRVTLDLTGYLQPYLRSTLS